MTLTPTATHTSIESGAVYGVLHVRTRENQLPTTGIFEFVTSHQVRIGDQDPIVMRFDKVNSQRVVHTAHFTN